MASDQTGTLYLCATPIGNMSDVTLRVIETLKSVDLIAAEDTRNSIRILNAYEIGTPMTSYHEHNKYDKAEYLIGVMRTGRNVALITDAGTPAISDPGEVLVRECQRAGIPVTSLPGPCACITALTLSGLPTRRFTFEGFLPYDKKEKAEVLADLRTEHRTVVLYEAPHHLVRTLKELFDALGDRRVTICRELTKKFETVTPTTLGEALDYYEGNEPRGEFVLVLEGRSLEEMKAEERSRWESMTLNEHLDMYLSDGLDKKEARKKVAADRGMSRRDVYNALLGK